MRLKFQFEVKFYEAQMLFNFRYDYIMEKSHLFSNILSNISDKVWFSQYFTNYLIPVWNMYT